MKSINSYNLPVQHVQEEKMKQPEEVEQILALHRLGWGRKRIAAEMGISKNTVIDHLNWTTTGHPRLTRILDSNRRILDRHVRLRFSLCPELCVNTKFDPRDGVVARQPDVGPVGIESLDVRRRDH